MTSREVGQVQAPGGAGTVRLAAVGPWIGLVARLVLGGVFIVAGALKVTDTSRVIRAVTPTTSAVPVATNRARAAVLRSASAAAGHRPAHPGVGGRVAC